MVPSNSPQFENENPSESERQAMLARLEDALLDLTRREGQVQSLDEALSLCTESSARALGVARTGIWIFDDDRTKITCLCEYDLETGGCTWGAELFARDYPVYFGALEENRALAADDVLTDSRTAELVEPYLVPHGVTSMLDAPIRQEGRVVGIACHEHKGRKRSWSLEEQHFAASIADLVALAIEHHSRVRVERELHDREVMLDGVAKTANRMFAEAEDELRYRDNMLEALAEAASRLLADHSPEGTALALGVLADAARLDSVSVFVDDTERASWRREGAARLQSGAGPVVSVPILVRDRIRGHVVFGTAAADREWSGADERFFRAAAATIGCALVAG